MTRNLYLIWNTADLILMYVISFYWHFIQTSHASVAHMFSEMKSKNICHRHETVITKTMHQLLKKKSLSRFFFWTINDWFSLINESQLFCSCDKIWLTHMNQSATHIWWKWLALLDSVMNSHWLRFYVNIFCLFRNVSSFSAVYYRLSLSGMWFAVASWL